MIAISGWELNNNMKSRQKKIAFVTGGSFEIGRCAVGVLSKANYII